MADVGVSECFDKIRSCLEAEIIEENQSMYKRAMSFDHRKFLSIKKGTTGNVLLENDCFLVVMSRRNESDDLVSSKARHAHYRRGASDVQLVTTSTQMSGGAWFSTQNKETMRRSYSQMRSEAQRKTDQSLERKRSGKGWAKKSKIKTCLASIKHALRVLHQEVEK